MTAQIIDAKEFFGDVTKQTQLDRLSLREVMNIRSRINIFGSEGEFTRKDLHLIDEVIEFKIIEG